MKKYTNLTKGFTLVEFPSMSNFISNTRLTNRAGQVANLFRFAKGEAVRLGVPVVVCGVKVRTDGRPSGVCSPSSVSSGMMAYADNNKNGMYDDGTDVMLRSVSINGNDNPEKMTVEVNKCKVDGTGCTTDSIVEYVFFANGRFCVFALKMCKERILRHAIRLLHPVGLLRFAKQAAHLMRQMDLAQS